MRFCFVVALLLYSSQIFSQNNLDSSIANSKIIIGDVIVSGNKKTKTNIILREMFLHSGDTVSAADLYNKISKSKQFIYNTTLFVSVDIKAAQQDANKIALIVTVKERWYIFPLPYFKLVDRNFTEWWNNQNHDFNRVNYGLRFLHNNLSGRNDKLNILLLTGYNRQVNVNYDQPFCNKKLTNGFTVGFTFSKQKELNYATSNSNKQQFFKLNNDFAKTLARFDFAFNHRPDKNWRHTFKIGYTAESVDDSVATKNKNYYGDSATEMKYVDFYYSITYANTNYNAYPTKGFIGSVGFYHRGLDALTNLSQVSVSSMVAIPLNKKIFVRNRTVATVKFPYSKSFINQYLVGYNDYIPRGLEKYVVDGVAGFVSKTNLGFNVFNFNVSLPVKSATYKKIPFNVYAKLYADIGYSHNPYFNNTLNNQFLHSHGIGIDIVTIYDIVFKFEYSINQLGESGLVFGN